MRCMLSAEVACLPHSPQSVGDMDDISGVASFDWLAITLAVGWCARIGCAVMCGRGLVGVWLFAPCWLRLFHVVQKREVADHY